MDPKDVLQLMYMEAVGSASEAEEEVEDGAHCIPFFLRGSLLLAN